MEEDITGPEPGGQPPPAEGESLSMEERKKALDIALKDAQAAINIACSENGNQITLLIFVCIVVILFAAILGCNIYHTTEYPTDLTIIYFVVTRIILVGAVFSLASFCFRVLGSYLHIYQRNKHRQLMIKSMSGLLVSASINQQDQLYQQLLNVIMNFDKTGLIKKGDSFQSSQFDKIYDMIEKLSPKKE